MVALLAEGVDRNIHRQLATGRPLQSPSSRRAWIEITSETKSARSGGVALLAEGVDRNENIIAQSSLTERVALLAEGVDRNLKVTFAADKKERRPPRGGRG